MSRVNDRIARIEQTLRGRRRLIAVRFLAQGGGYTDQPPILIGGTKASRAEAMKKWEEEVAEKRKVGLDPVTHPDVTSPLVETAASGSDASPASVSASEGSVSRWATCSRCGKALEVPYALRVRCPSCGCANV